MSQDSFKVACYSAKKYDRDSFESQRDIQKDQLKIEFSYFDAQLSEATVPLAGDHNAVCLFVNDDANAEVLQGLHELGIKFVALRCAGFNNVGMQSADRRINDENTQVDLKEAAKLGIKVATVPAYSPDAVAEFAVGMMLTLMRKYHKSYNRVREGNFLLEGLVGSTLKAATVGIIGTGRIGLLTGKILSQGFGARVIAYDKFPNKTAAEAHGIVYVPTMDDLLHQATIVSLHCPLTPENKHLINDESIKKMKDGVIIVNTSRGALIDATALIHGLKHRKIQAVGMDVYEKEQEYFFRDGSAGIMEDDILARLISFPNVFISGHQAFLTVEALAAIATTTLENLTCFGRGTDSPNLVKPYV